MSDFETIREALELSDVGRGSWEPALSRVETELAEAKREFVQIPTTAQILRAEAAEAEVQRLQEKLNQEEFLRADLEEALAKCPPDCLANLTAALAPDTETP